MDEAQRFLRYVLPGIVFLAELLVLLFILFPDWTTSQLKVIKGDQGLGVVLASVLASGGIGFVLSVLYHVILWSPLDRCRFNHAPIVASLRTANVIQLRDATTNAQIRDDAAISRHDAWVIATSLWNERVDSSRHIKGANRQAALLVDMLHAVGTARVATPIAWIAVLFIATHIGHISWEYEPVLRFVFAIVVAALLFATFHCSFVRISNLYEDFVAEVLHDALRLENQIPIITRVTLR